MKRRTSDLMYKKTSTPSMTIVSNVGPQQHERCRHESVYHAFPFGLCSAVTTTTAQPLLSQLFFHTDRPRIIHIIIFHACRYTLAASYVYHISRNATRPYISKGLSPGQRSYLRPEISACMEVARSMQVKLVCREVIGTSLIDRIF